MKEIYQIFSESPFKYLESHMVQVELCIREIELLMNGFLVGSFEQLSEHVEKINRAENEADLIKQRIRGQLPKSIFMPVAREDVLKLLHYQDNLADRCQDLAMLISVRHTVIIPQLREDILVFVQKNVLPATRVVELTHNMQNLLETSFSGPKAKVVLDLIDEVCRLESDADTAKFLLLKKMFNFESEMDTLSVVFLLKIVDCISLLADSSQKVANIYRLMISKQDV